MNVIDVTPTRSILRIDIVYTLRYLLKMDVEYIHHGILFEWDSDKAAANVAKHGVSFETACEVFFDPFVRVSDEELVGDEARDTVIGMTLRWKVLCVIYTVRIGDRYRIISAREATPKERLDYEGQ
jgi:uncharacterized DUF497 family protein